METVLVTGGAGYLGSILTPSLLDKGYKVIIFDTLYFGNRSISPLLSNKNLTLVEGDIRSIKQYEDMVAEADHVVHLAALSNDPSCDIDQKLAVAINYGGTTDLADICRKVGTKRFIYASSCSVYGWKGDKILNEEETTNPVSTYAETKIDSEKYLLSIAGDEFTPTVLRMSTLYGYSPRMRFDLAINIMTLNAIRDKEITISGGGTQWRPFLHVGDAARAFIHFIESPLSNKGGYIHNVGSNKQNYSISMLAELVKEHIPNTSLCTLDDNPDKRSYRVSFDKIGTAHYRTKGTIEGGIKEISQFINSNNLDFNDPIFYNIRTMKGLGFDCVTSEKMNIAL